MVIFATSSSTFEPISLVGKIKNCSIQRCLFLPNLNRTCLQFCQRCFGPLDRPKFEESMFMQFTKARPCFCFNFLNSFRRNTAFNFSLKITNLRITKNSSPAIKRIFAAVQFGILRPMNRHLITLQSAIASFTFAILATS